MKYMLSISSILFATFLSGQTPALIPYRSGNLWGYARPGGQIVVPPQFLEAGLLRSEIPTLPASVNMTPNGPTYPVFSHAIAEVRKDSLYGLINDEGELIIKPVSPAPFNFFPIDSNVIWIGIPKPLDGGEDCRYWKTALLSKSGRLLTPFKYDIRLCFEGEEETWPLPSSDGALDPNFVKIWQGSRAGYLRKDGVEVFPPLWEGPTLLLGPDRMLAKQPDTTGVWYLVGPGNIMIKQFPQPFDPELGARNTPIRIMTDHGIQYMNAAGEWVIRN
jgi:hypothetical protein